MFLNVADVKSYIFPSGKTGDDLDTQIITLIPVVESIIEKRCGRKFSPYDEIKYYDGNGLEFLEIDDVLTVETLTVNNVTIPDADFKIWPYNSYPKTQIRLVDATFPVGVQNVSIEGTWGYAETVPDEIYVLALNLARQLLLQGVRFEQIYTRASIATPEGDPIRPSDADGRVLWTKDMLDIVHRYRRRKVL